jgi:acyl-coenzyme A synthetase/AMP-(fatty) acid ligase
VGEPINEEAWHWYNNNVGKKNSPIIDTWWQTETGGMMITPIPYVTPTTPTYATLPFIGIQPTLMNEEGKEIKGNQVDGRLCIKFPWPSIARTIWGNHERYRDTYFSAYRNALYGYVILKEMGEERNRENLKKEINQQITEQIGPIAKLDKIQFVSGLPKTRSGKIMRRILRKIASKDTSNLGDTSTLLNPEVVQDIMDNAL